MPNVMAIRKLILQVFNLPAPDPGLLPLYIKGEMSHELIGIWGNPGLGDRYVRSEIISSMPAQSPFSAVGEFPVVNPLLNPISIGVSHALS